MVAFVVAVDFTEAHRKKVEGPPEKGVESFSTMERGSQRSCVFHCAKQGATNGSLFVKCGEVGTYSRPGNKHRAELDTIVQIKL